jgi:uncharacterized protein
MTKSVRDFQVFAKPIGPLCNLACRYCYYSSIQTSQAGTESLRMPDSLLEEYVRQHIEATAGETVSFSWHGGEPTLMGLDYFRRSSPCSAGTCLGTSACLTECRQTAC